MTQMAADEEKTKPKPISNRGLSTTLTMHFLYLSGAHRRHLPPNLLH
jgi:hypothetical protein